ncbi:MAG: serine hydrolase domain-containing protein [bacterium]
MISIFKKTVKIRKSLESILIGIIALGVSITTTHAQSNELLQARMRLFEAWLNTLMSDQSLRGVSVSLVQNQKLIYAKGFGVSDFEKQSPATESTNYRIASITKLFTSIALMQLVERKKIFLDTPVVEIIPELRAIKTNGHSVEDITIKSILTHTTGLPTNPNFLLDKRGQNQALALDEFLKGLAQQSLLFPPNRIHKYSNLAMNLGGLIVERVSGLSYEQYIQEVILTPLQLESTRFPTDSETTKVIGYSRIVGDQRLKNEFPEMASVLGLPSSGPISTVTDLAKFISWHFRTLSAEDQTLLARATLSEMQKVQWVPLPIELHPRLNTALALLANTLELGGTGLGYFREKEFVLHSGGLMGFASELVMDNQNNTVEAPVYFNHPQSFSRNLYEMVGRVLADPKSFDRPLLYAEYENLYSDDHHWHYYVTEMGENLILLNLREGMPLAMPIVLSKVGVDHFVDPNHEGVYAGEFSVYFQRDQNGKVDSMIVKNNKLYPKD